MHPDDERADDDADEEGWGLLIALMAAGLIPVVAAWIDGAPIDGAASAGFLVALSAIVLLTSSLSACGRGRLRGTPKSRSLRRCSRSSACRR